MTVTMELGVSGRAGLVCVPTDLMVIWPLDVVVITIWKKLPGTAVTKKFLCSDRVAGLFDSGTQGIARQGARRLQRRRGPR
ncbi:MAG: hypothetical protein ACO3D1_03610 [Ilumatobacteraceae bacterium]